MDEESGVYNFRDNYVCSFSKSLDEERAIRDFYFCSFSKSMDEESRLYNFKGKLCLYF